ncbi:MAG TPA: TetR/AcrR family transcriptional regulator [Acidimicrobiales bacterium]
MTVAERQGSPRDRLLQAAREVVAAEGLEGLTLRAIARRAGVSHGAPLRHFPTLAALLAAVAADGFARLAAAVEAALAGADAAAAARGARLGARERLAAAGLAYVRFALAEPGVFTVTFRPERVDVGDPGYQRQGMASFGQLVGLVEAAQAEGWQAGQPPALLAATLWAHVHGVAELALHGALGGVVGGDAAGRVLALSTALALDVDPASVPGLDGTAATTNQGDGS